MSAQTILLPSCSCITGQVRFRNVYSVCCKSISMDAKNISTKPHDDSIRRIKELITKRKKLNKNAYLFNDIRLVSGHR